MTSFRPRKSIWPKHICKAPAVLFACAASLPAQAQTLGLAPSHEVSPWRIVGALLFCCVLGLAAALALRFRMRGKAMPTQGLKAVNWRQFMADFGVGTKTSSAGAGRLRLIETARLGYQVEVNLLECDGKSIVVVTSPHGAFVANPDAPDRAGNPS